MQMKDRDGQSVANYSLSSSHKSCQGACRLGRFPTCDSPSILFPFPLVCEFLPHCDLPVR